MRHGLKKCDFVSLQAMKGAEDKHERRAEISGSGRAGFAQNGGGQEHKDVI
jgi:hypothetical protein